MGNSASSQAMGAAITNVAIECTPSSAKLVFRGRAAALQAIGRALGLDIRAVSGRYVEQGDDRALWLGPDEWLLKSSTPADHLAHTLEQASAGLPHAIVDVSSTYMTLRVSGQDSELVVNHGCPLDLSLQGFHIGACTRTLLGKAGMILSRIERNTFELDVARSFSGYARRFLREACVGLASPSGAAALQREPYC